MIMNGIAARVARGMAAIRRAGIDPSIVVDQLDDLDTSTGSNDVLALLADVLSEHAEEEGQDEVSRGDVMERVRIHDARSEYDHGILALGDLWGPGRDEVIAVGVLEFDPDETDDEYEALDAAWRQAVHTAVMTHV